jgi:hypothetical protein
MSYIVLFVLIACGYILGAPIVQESLQFRLIDCIEGDNETLSKHIIEISNINETCIRVNKSSTTGHEVYLYLAQESETGVKIHFDTENCSTPLPDLHLSLCDQQDISNQTETMVTFPYNNISLFEELIDENNSTFQTELYTGPVVYETLHNLKNDSDEDTATLQTALYTGPVVYETMHNLKNYGDEDEDHIITNNESSTDYQTSTVEDDSSEEE